MPAMAIQVTTATEREKITKLMLAVSSQIKFIKKAGKEKYSKNMWGTARSSPRFWRENFSLINILCP